MSKEKLNKVKKNRWFVCTVVIVFLCLTGSLFCQKTFAATGTIKGTNINVRSDAGAANSKITTVTAGDLTVVLGKKKDTAGKWWYQVSFLKNGKEYQGYIIEDYITVSEDVPNLSQSSDTKNPTETTTKKNMKQASVIGTNVNVRKKTVVGAIVGKVNSGDAIIVIRSKKSTDSKKWHYIAFLQAGKVKKGWIRSDFVKLGQTVDSLDVLTQTEPQEKQETQEVQEIQQEETQQSKNPGTPNIATIKEMTPDIPGIDKKAVKYATVSKKTAKVRKRTVNGQVKAQLMKGDIVGILRKKKAKDGYIWYYISFSWYGEDRKGWVRKDRLKIGKRVDGTDAVSKIDASSSNEDAKPELSDAEFETYLKTQGFPEDYKVALRTLHKTYPKWTFRAVQTNLKWSDVIAAETKAGLNLVSKTAIASWKSTAITAYDYKRNVWYTFDGGSWVAASDALVQYYMDPRNFLDENSIFQFESLEYENYQNAAGVKELLKSSFMKGDFTEPDGTVKNYANTFVEIGKEVGVSPYHLAARCYQEQGKGTSASISGTVKGYENLFNYYNIGAYATGKNSPTTQGLIYASATASSESLNYDRPWNTRYKSLLGGAKYVASKYVKVGQNTLYFQKFNVVNTKNGIYKHQYMTNIQAAAAEAVKMSNAYVDKNTELVFYIPVYVEMPKKQMAKPTGNLNPNNYLASISVDSYKLMPVFDGATEQYYLTVDAKVDQVTITAKPVVASSTVQGTGVVPLVKGENDVQLQCTSQSGETKCYHVNITRK